jgi:acyl-CoA thioesterase YciA
MPGCGTPRRVQRAIMTSPPFPPMPSTPQGEIVVRTIAQPADTNGNGDIFGGWLMSQMDLGGAVLARRTSLSRVATVAVDAMTFHSPVRVGDVVTCYARLLKIGTTSMRIALEAWVERFTSDAPERVTAAEFTYVAIDEDRRPQPVKR